MSLVQWQKISTCKYSASGFAAKACRYSTHNCSDILSKPSTSLLSSGKTSGCEDTKNWCCRLNSNSPYQSQFLCKHHTFLSAICRTTSNTDTMAAGCAWQSVQVFGSKLELATYTHQQRCMWVSCRKLAVPCTQG